MFGTSLTNPLTGSNEEVVFQSKLQSKISSIGTTNFLENNDRRARRQTPFKNQIYSFLIMYPRLFFVYFRLFKQTLQSLQQINRYEKCPSIIQCWDSNPQPSEHESPPITTRPGLSSNIGLYYNQNWTVWDGKCRKQCDQMATLFFQYLALQNNEILRKSIKYLPKQEHNFAKYSRNGQRRSKIWPKWQNFAKSGHTSRKEP